MNVADDRRQHRIRTVVSMRRFTSFMGGFGAAGATANARAELETAHVTCLQAAMVARRVQQSSGRADDPLSSPAVARVA